MLNPENPLDQAGQLPGDQQIEVAPQYGPSAEFPTSGQATGEVLSDDGSELASDAHATDVEADQAPSEVREAFKFAGTAMDTIAGEIPSKGTLDRLTRYRHANIVSRVGSMAGAHTLSGMPIQGGMSPLRQAAALRNNPQAAEQAPQPTQGETEQQ